MNQPKPRQISWLDSTEHRDWLAKHREALLDFFQPEVVLPGAGYAYLDSRGHALPRLGSQLWLGARMLHCFSIAAMQGRPGAEDVSRHGIGFYLNGAGRDTEHGGWFPTVGGDSPSFRKELYGQAHILLGASSATIAGIPGGEDLLAAALEVIERFWVEADGAGIDAFDREFHRAEPYRGQNANMHLAEAYLAAHELVTERDRYPAFNIPIICVPASIDNNLPGSELSIGADTALNNAIGALDSIKQSAAASRRCFVAESMGRKCGYLALMSGIATGAERVYLNEDGLTLAQLARDSARMVESFRSGRDLYLVIRNERASENYTLDVLAKIFAQEGRGLYDVRHAALGHLQQGGDPSAFDRIMATKLVAHALDLLADQLGAGTHHSSYVGLTGGRISHHRLERMNDELDLVARRPLHQWWMGLREAISLVSQNSGVIPMEDIPDFGAAVSAAAAPSE